MHLLEVGKEKVLLDCGLYLGSRSETHHYNRPFPFQPPDIGAVVLSHAHIDHCGNLPNLVRQGFTGPIFCTPPTRDLLAFMLLDSARIHEEDASLLRLLEQSDRPGGDPLYARADALQTLEQCVPVPYEQTREINAHVRFRFVDAGHILGSAMIALAVEWEGRSTTLTYTGDLGRLAMTFLCPPAAIPAADLVICECTYGGRLHEPLVDTLAALHAVVTRTVAQEGKVLIPAFSLGRAQLVVHYLQEGMRAGRIPDVPVYVDSPLAADVAAVYGRYPESLSGGTAAARRLIPDGVNGQAATVQPMAEEGGQFRQKVQYIRTREHSKEVSTRRGAAVLVASGGMLEGGRILRHLQHHIDDPRSSVVLVSYQALESLGRRLLERGPTVRFLGRQWNKWAHIVEIPGFSGHADQNDFLTLFQPLAGRAARVRLVHGDLEQAEALAGALRQRQFADVQMPCRGEKLNLF
jgi:metallo-beta-lactamase family protein